MHFNRWSVRSMAIVVAVCVLGGLCLIGVSAGPDDRRSLNEVGRFQMLQTPRGLAIFDTRTAQYWERDSDGADRWQAKDPPWAGGKVRGP